MTSKSYKIRYSRHIDKKKVARIPSRDLNRIHKAIKQKLGSRPDVFGKPLRKSLKGCWAIRIGDYRIVYKTVKKTIEIIAIDHRSVVYKDLAKQLKSLGIDVRW